MMGIFVIRMYFSITQKGCLRYNQLRTMSGPNLK